MADSNRIEKCQDLKSRPMENIPEWSREARFCIVLSADGLAVLVSICIVIFLIQGTFI